jgi:hypothetical protein
MKEFNDVIDCILVKDLYFMFSNKNIIEIYDNDLNYIEKIKINDSFFSITYDEDKNIFYLSKDNEIYKTEDFKSFELIKINLDNCYGNIKKIFFCRHYNSLLITTRNAVLMFEINSKKINILFKLTDKISKYNGCTSPLGCKSYNQVCLIDAICCCDDIYIVYRINNKSVIKRKDNKIYKVVYETSLLIKSLFIAKNEIWVVVDNDCKQKIISTSIKCLCDCDLSDCNCQIISSIASIEKSLAKILKSESLKIKSVIENSDNVKDLIRVNTSVKETIYYITILEFILTEKLKIVSDKKR